MPDTDSGASGSSRLRLGHIAYSNCFPVHARLLDRPAPGDPALREGTPAALNRLLSEGSIDIAPSSSIEYALHPDTHRILPDLAIGSRGAVRSIVFLAERPIPELGGHTVAVPTASATSVVLLKILLRVRWDVDVRFRWFDQMSEDPFATGAAAALFIGDVALRKDLHPLTPVRLDLGEEWWNETGLPFVFAVWQAASGSAAELRRLHQLLLESRTYGRDHRSALAKRYSRHFAMPAGALAAYWEGLVYDLDPAMIEGLKTFYQLAQEIGELDRVPPLRWIE
ncbi:MAG: menaquinone biosynthesis protein [Gemmatimonadota bacterium]